MNELQTQGTKLQSPPSRYVPLDLNPTQAQRRLEWATRRLNFVFGTGKGKQAKLPVVEKNYIYFQGGTMRFGRLTMAPVDMELVNLQGSSSFEFALADYYRQLVAGYSKSLPGGGLLVHMANDQDVQSKLSTSPR